jgi:hypothetical protein
MISNILKASALLFVFLIFISCEKDNDNNSNVDAVWEKQFYFGNFTVNGQPVLTNEEETTSEFIKDFVCYNALPSSSFTNVSFYVYIPTNVESIPGFEVSSHVIFYDGTNISFGRGDNQLNVVDNESIINGVSYSVFSVEVSVPINLITRDNFQQLRFDFDMIHLDSDTEQELNRDDKFIQININPC